MSYLLVLIRHAEYILIAPRVHVR